MNELKKVAVIDDEAAGRKLIKEYLENYENFFVVAEANNGVDAVKVINEFKPDLIFLDIQMPALTGFEVLQHLEELPKIIFSTAYDEYAMQAFEVNAIDYLLKPYTARRFEAAMNKLNFFQPQTALQPLTENLMMEQNSYPKRILVQHNKKLINISTKEIIWIEAYGDYAKLVTDEGIFVSNFGIGVLEQKLNPEFFVRVHRSSMINIHFIKEVNKYTNSYDVVMQNNDVVRVSRGYMENLKKLMF
ncbi:response regulator [Bernardetia sp. ABR2-2B]|uniref:LytR/AlgR family response regulator transcription factor n=1 Tax=Bernardetia sp. ABR2-2B TaxID=3127472 RepID=UPI0030CD5110